MSQIRTKHIANLAVTAAKLSSGAATIGQVATADGSGNVSYQSLPGSVSGDLNDSFTAADNQATPANVTGFAFANGTVRSFDAIVSIVRGSTYAQWKLNGIQKASSWEMSQVRVGDDTGIVFSITSAGQVQYTSTSTGSTALIKFRAFVTPV